VNGVIDGLEAIEAQPAVRMTSDQFGQAMTRTGRELMNEVAQKYDHARQDAERERRHLEEMIGTLEGKQEQRLLLGIPAVVFLFTLLIAPFLISALPFGLNEWVGSIVMGGR
jgi:hypothetical protein